ncbi:MAG: SDR family NAD(P)-dependent oxidoreductase [Emcibacteraceae bacterium]|nr:SDR family NAD(P)-dependent oxidoreductase [Emcibacteraceae bacterium]
MKNPKSILITGASSGIGEALAMEYADNGISLYLSGRNKERLDKVAAKCKALSATVTTNVINVTNKQATKEWINGITTLDLVIANAGIGKSFKADDDLDEHITEIFDTNLNGVFNTTHPSINKMKKQGRGQIALISSIAGYRGMPSAPGYSASKIAVKGYGEALRGFYHGQNIQINVICPGFVRSRITDKNNFKMPFYMEAPKAAKIIRRDLAKNKGLITFPWQMRMIAGIMFNLIPDFLLEKMLRRLPNK